MRRSSTGACRAALAVAGLWLCACNAIFGLGEYQASAGDPGAGGSSEGGALDACANGQRDDGEEGVDCGGSCAPCGAGELGLGSACADSSECASGFCPSQDGVCCDTPCSLTCEACIAAKTGADAGRCRLIPSGDDPDGECEGVQESECGSRGDGCSGTGTACAVWNEETVCLAASCQNGEQQLASYCDGVSQCVPGETTGCGRYLCDGDVCRTTCAGHGDCTATSWCNLGSCVARCTACACTLNAQCLSNNCVNGGCVP